MIKLDIDNLPTGIHGEVLSQAMIDHMPAWVVGNAAPPNGKIGAALSLVKGIAPTILNFLYMEAKKKGGDIPAPDFKSPEAKRNTLAYVIRYLLDNFAAAASREHFTAQGAWVDGIYVISNIVSTGPVVAEPGQEGDGISPAPALASLD